MSGKTVTLGRRAVAAVLFALWSVASTVPAQVASPHESRRGTQAPAHDAAPRLIVMLVVDQMRADYLDTFARRWKRGFATLLERGAVFEHAEYPYMNTVTCAGHTVITSPT